MNLEEYLARLQKLAAREHERQAQLDKDSKKPPAAEEVDEESSHFSGFSY